MCKSALGGSVKYCVLVDAEQSPDGAWGKRRSRASGFFLPGIVLPLSCTFSLVIASLANP